MSRRKPSKKKIRKHLWKYLVILVGILGGALAFFGFFLHQVIAPAPAPEDVGPSHFLLSSENVAWYSSDGEQVSGWWVSGREGSPGIVLATGYELSRSDALSLAAALHHRGYHCLIYDGSGLSTRGVSTLGLQETEDMLAAIDFTLGRPGVGRQHLGLWGVDIAARAALEAAAQRPEVLAVAADSVYDTVGEFLSLKITESTGTDNRIMEQGCRYVFLLYLRAGPAALDSILPLEYLAERSILFIQGENREDMVPFTAALFERFQPQKERIALPHARVRRMNADQLEAYDQKIVNFFQRSFSKSGTGSVDGLVSNAAFRASRLCCSDLPADAAQPSRY